MSTKLAFDDVTLVHQFSQISSRKDVDTSVRFGLINHETLTAPIISANMSTVTDDKLAIAMYKSGGLGALHRFCNIEKNVEMYTRVRESGANCLVSVGLGDNEFTRAVALYNAGARMFILDVANGASAAVAEQSHKIQSYKKDIYMMVGNFGSARSVEGFLEFCYKEKLGYPNGFKLGIGPGRNCITSKETGVGYPMFSLIQEVKELLNDYDWSYDIIADGGIRSPCDMVKAFVAGADLVMMGGEFSGCFEAAGSTFVQDGQLYKKHYGSASKEAYEEQGKNQDYITPEGVSFDVKVDKYCADVVNRYLGGLRSAMTYLDCYDKSDLYASAFITVSSAGEAQNSAHGLKK